MDMLETMRFIRGAVSTKSLVPEMKHFYIKDGFIRAYNGVIALSSPIDFEVNCSPIALPLIAAISKCEDVTTLSMLPSGRLKIQSGKFKAFIDCEESETLPLEPEGEFVELDGDVLMDAIKVVMPFVGNDASRPWVNGVYLKDMSAYATNNVCLVQYWIGVQMPLSANIPIEAIREMIRIKQSPIKAQVSENTITFHYPDGRWLRTLLYSTDWPDLTRILDRPSEQKPIPATMFEGLESIRPFLEKNGNVYFRDGVAYTSATDDVGASYQIEGLEDAGIYKLDMLMLLKDMTTADFSTYPDPCMFFGDRVRGAILGLRA